MTISKKAREMALDDIEKAPANRIPVPHLRQIFHLPLSLFKPKDGEALKSQMNGVCAALSRDTDRWTITGDRLKETNSSVVYREAAYFHDFVRDFLYPKPSQDKPGHTTADRRCFRRADLEGSEIVFMVNGGGAPFKIIHLTIDLFSFGVAILTVELEFTGKDLRLDRAQTIIDHIRRAFPGFWFGNDSASVPGLCPSGVEMLVKGKSEKMSAGPQSEQINRLADTRSIRLFPWWREILAPLRLEGEEGDAPQWRHVLDERVPVMTYLSLTEPGKDPATTIRRISDGDWFRIAAADQAGSDPYPYNKAFLEPQARQLFYDRFLADGYTTSATRHSFAGYAYAMVGAGGFHDTHAREHFSSHYRQMNFIAHLEFAALLTFSRRLTDLVRRDDADDTQAFRKRLQSIRKDYLDYTHQYLFTDVSNHLQAREMNAMLRASLGLSELRRDVEAELNAASDFAHAEEQTELAQSQAMLTDFATLFLPATLGAGFVGMNLLVAPEGVYLEFSQQLTRGFWWMGLAYLIGWGCYSAVTGMSMGKVRPGKDRLSSKLFGGAIFCFVLGYVALWAHLRP